MDYHHLEHAEREALPTIGEAVLEQCSELLQRWYQAYASYMNGTRSLDEAQFASLLEPAITSANRTLISRDLAAYLQEVRGAAESLAGHGLPPSEIMLVFALLRHVESEMLALRFPRQSPVGNCLERLHIVQIASIAESCSQRDAPAAVLARGNEARPGFHGLVGDSPEMRQVYTQIETIAASPAITLIVGESGTGKELAARALHECAGNAAVPFVAVNCAAISHDLLESELFGHKRGAFSGANENYSGLIRAADGGTLFLDEITEMAGPAQAKLLRATEQGCVRPVGSTNTVPINVRIVAATNRNPEEAVALGHLRRDLYYRFQVILRLPPLRDRLQDVPALTEHFITMLRPRIKRAGSVRGVDAGALAAMQAYHWPGNVRELANAIETALLFGRSTLIRAQDLPPAITGDCLEPVSSAGNEDESIGTLAQAESSHIRRALVATEGNVLKASQLLGISRKKLYSRIAKYRLSHLLKGAAGSDSKSRPSGANR